MYLYNRKELFNFNDFFNPEIKKFKHHKDFAQFYINTENVVDEINYIFWEHLKYQRLIYAALFTWIAMVELKKIKVEQEATYFFNPGLNINAEHEMYPGYNEYKNLLKVVNFVDIDIESVAKVFNKYNVDKSQHTWNKVAQLVIPYYFNAFYTNIGLIPDTINYIHLNTETNNCFNFETSYLNIQPRLKWFEKEIKKGTADLGYLFIHLNSFLLINTNFKTATNYYLKILKDELESDTNSFVNNNFDKLKSNLKKSKLINNYNKYLLDVDDIISYMRKIYELIDYKKIESQYTEILKYSIDEILNLK